MNPLQEVAIAVTEPLTLKDLCFHYENNLSVGELIEPIQEIYSLALEQRDADAFQRWQKSGKSHPSMFFL